MTMNEIVLSIHHVTDIMNEINLAGREQSDDIAQVSETIAQKDHNTQQNTTLVEQTAAAAESLSTQAQQLVLTIEMFRINQDKIKKVSNSNEKYSLLPLKVNSSVALLTVLRIFHD